MTSTKELYSIQAISLENKRNSSMFLLCFLSKRPHVRAALIELDLLYFIVLIIFNEPLIN